MKTPPSTYRLISSCMYMHVKKGLTQVKHHYNLSISDKWLGEKISNHLNLEIIPKLLYNGYNSNCPKKRDNQSWNYFREMVSLGPYKILNNIINKLCFPYTPKLIKLVKCCSAQTLQISCELLLKHQKGKLLFHIPNGRWNCNTKNTASLSFSFSYLIFLF